MKLNMYAIYSTLAELYHQEGIFLFRTDAHAESVLSQRIGEKEKAFTQIVRVGSFDVVTGDVICSTEQIIVPYTVGPAVDSLPVEQTKISHKPASIQETQFQERIADIRTHQ